MEQRPEAQNRLSNLDHILKTSEVADKKPSSDDVQKALAYYEQTERNSLGAKPMAQLRKKRTDKQTAIKLRKSAALFAATAIILALLAANTPKAIKNITGTPKIIETVEAMGEEAGQIQYITKHSTELTEKLKSMLDSSKREDALDIVVDFLWESTTEDDGKLRVERIYASYGPDITNQALARLQKKIADEPKIGATLPAILHILPTGEDNYLTAFCKNAGINPEDLSWMVEVWEALDNKLGREGMQNNRGRI